MRKSTLISIAIAFSLGACATPTLKSVSDPAEGLSYFLPKRLHQIEITQSLDKDKCKKTLQLTDAGLFPDTNYQFAIQPVHNRFRNENTVLLTDSNGLLTSSTTTTTGTVGTTLVNAAQSAAAVAEIFGIAGTPEGEDEKDECPTISVNRYFDFGRSTNRMAATELLNNHGYIMSYDDDLLNLNSEVRTIVSEKGIAGIYYRRSKSYLNTITCKADIDTSCDIKNVVLELPQGMTISQIKTYGDTFTAESDSVSFAQGMLTGWTIDRKSEAAEIAKLPLDIIEAVLEVPASLLTLRVANTTQENLLQTGQNNVATTTATGERAEIIRDINANLLRLCIAEAGTDTARLMACANNNGS